MDIGHVMYFKMARSALEVDSPGRIGPVRETRPALPESPSQRQAYPEEDAVKLHLSVGRSAYTPVKTETPPEKLEKKEAKFEQEFQEGLSFENSNSPADKGSRLNIAA